MIGAAFVVLVAAIVWRTIRESRAVSRNPSKPAVRAAYEQDAPMAECFDEMTDLDESEF